MKAWPSASSSVDARSPHSRGERAERLGLGRQVALQRADGIEVAIGQRLGRRRLARRLRLDELRGRVAIALDVEVDADLEEAQRRHRADHVDLGELAQQLDGAIEAELRARRHGEREPHVQLVLAQVVVAHARMRREHGGGLVLPLRGHARGDEHAAVAEPARVEDRRDLADDLLLAQRGHALEHRVLVAADAARRAPRRAARRAATRSGCDPAAASSRSSTTWILPAIAGCARRHRRCPPRRTVGYSACAHVESSRCFSSSPPSPSWRPAASRRRSRARPSPARSPSARAPPRQTVNPGTAGGATSGGRRPAPRRRAPAGDHRRATGGEHRRHDRGDDGRRLGRRPRSGQDRVHRDLRRLPHAQGRGHERQGRARSRQPRAAHGRTRRARRSRTAAARCRRSC